MLASETFDAMKTGPKVSAVVLMLQLIMLPVSVGEWQFSLVSLLYINFVYCSLLKVILLHSDARGSHGALLHCCQRDV
jgi:hypothetical protein